MIKRSVIIVNEVIGIIQQRDIIWDVEKLKYFILLNQLAEKENFGTD
jgi:hypothetical protein